MGKLQWLEGSDEDTGGDLGLPMQKPFGFRCVFAGEFSDETICWSPGTLPRVNFGNWPMRDEDEAYRHYREYWRRRRGAGRGGRSLDGVPEASATMGAPMALALAGHPAYAAPDSAEERTISGPPTYVQQKLAALGYPQAAAEVGALGMRNPKQNTDCMQDDFGSGWWCWTRGARPWYWTGNLEKMQHDMDSAVRDAKVRNWKKRPKGAKDW